MAADAPLLSRYCCYIYLGALSRYIQHDGAPLPPDLVPLARVEHLDSVPVPVPDSRGQLLVHHSSHPLLQLLLAADPARAFLLVVGPQRRLEPLLGGPHQVEPKGTEGPPPL